MFERYKIKKGDTLSIISKKYDTNIDYLKSINDIYFIDDLREGTDIIVPKTKDLYYEVIKNSKGDTLVNIAKKYNLNPSLLASMNGLENDDYIYNNQELLLPKMNYSYYISKKGDTLDTVSNIFGITKDRLLSQNESIYLLDGQIIVNKKIK